MCKLKGVTSVTAAEPVAKIRKTIPFAHQHQSRNAAQRNRREERGIPVPHSLPLAHFPLQRRETDPKAASGALQVIASRHPEEETGQYYH